MDRSELINELATALSKAQGEMTEVIKSQVANGKTFSYNYASLEDVIEVVKQPLLNNGLAVSQLMDNIAGEPALTTIMMHTSGQWQAATIPLVVVKGNGTNAAQDLGISITYTKRYALAGICLVSIVDDVDGNAGNHTQPVTHKPAIKRTPPPTDNISLDNAPDLDDPYGDEPTAPAGLPFLVIDRVGAAVARNGKQHIGLWEPGKQYPSLRWWKGRDELLTECPWLIEVATKDDLGNEGATFPFNAHVYYTENDKGFKDIDGFERIA